MQKEKIRNSILLLLTAVIWGTAFVAQSVGMDYIGPFTFNAARFLIGGTVLIPLIVYRSKKNPLLKNQTLEEKRKNQKTAWIGGVCCGIALCGASLLQQMGIQHTTVGKAGFITTLYIIIVPLIELFFGKKIAKKIWLGAVMAVIGLYLLCINENFSIGKGDFLILVCAILFAIHILIIDHFSPKADGVVLSAIQFFVSGFISVIGAILVENPNPAAMLDAIVPILYAGVMSCGVAYTLQVIGQKNISPTVASMILSLESVISVLAGWIILGEALSAKEIVGCVIVFMAVVLVQLPEKKK
ncbi:DMT family transporter [Faecalimonas hominis]